MDLFLIILSGVCLIGLAIYWIRLWREARDHKRAQALHRVADEKAAVRGLARPISVTNDDMLYREMASLQSAVDAVDREDLAAYESAHDAMESFRACHTRVAAEWDRLSVTKLRDILHTIMKERDDLQHQVASLKNVNDSLAKVATAEQSRSIQRTISEIRSDSVMHALATAMPWFAVRYDGIHFACSHEVRLNAAGSVWELRNTTVEFDGTYKLVILEKIDPVGWRDSLLHYNQATRTWDKPA